MLSNSKIRTYFQLKQKIDGKNEKILTIECKHCIEFKKPFYKNSNCIVCFFKNLHKNKNKNFDCILVDKLKTPFEIVNLSLFFEYFSIIKKFKLIFNKIKKFKSKRCNLTEFKCKISPEIDLFKIDENLYYDPFLFYHHIKEQYNIIKTDKIINDPFCDNCFNYIKVEYENTFNLLNSLKLIAKVNTLKNSINSSEIAVLYKSLLLEKNILSIKKKATVDIQNEMIENIIDVYEIGKNQLFKVSIYNILEDDEKKYDVCLNFGSEAEKIFYNEIIKDVTNNLKIFNFDNIVPLENLIEIYKQAFLRILNSNFKFNNKIKNKIAYLASIQKLNLKKIFPFLIDDYIEEIFLDSSKGYIYLNHQTYGRCRTEVKFSQNELERLKTFIRLYSGLRLDYSNPSVKHVIKNKYFYCRFAIDVDPINPNNFAMDIRKLNRNILTIQDLIKNNTLDSLMAAFLYYCILNRNNITVTGETDTGKTTLINALDLLTPKGFRKIYVENIIESLNQSSFYKHQLKFKVDPLDYDLNEKFTKSSLIKTLLHRTPDLIYLGEILTREEAEALFHCLAAGLRGFQTIHCNDIDSLINRFLYHFKIDPSCLKDLNLIVLMKKDHTKRRVISINEINPIVSKKNMYYRTIFNFNSKIEKWEVLIPLYETNAIHQIKLYKNLNLEDFNLTIQTYTEIFNFISKLKKLDNFELVAFFHKVSYYSMRSITLLKDFWETWKNKWSLNL